MRDKDFPPASESAITPSDQEMEIGVLQAMRDNIKAKLLDRNTPLDELRSLEPQSKWVGEQLAKAERGEGVEVPEATPATQELSSGLSSTLKDALTQRVMDPSTSNEEVRRILRRAEQANRVTSHNGGQSLNDHVE